jgi:hypothetical protein
MFAGPGELDTAAVAGEKMQERAPGHHVAYVTFEPRMFAGDSFAAMIHAVT